MNKADKRLTKKSAQLYNKEQEFKELNAALEEKTASLINEAESVLRGQENLFMGLDAAESDFSNLTIESNKKDTAKDKRITSKLPPSKTTTKQRPISGPVGGTKKRDVKKPVRPASSKEHLKKMTSPLSFVEERATFADRINTLELEAEDDMYTPSHLNDNVLPEAANELGADATIRFLKAKLRVMQEELENIAAECREKASKISELQNDNKENDTQQMNLVKKNEMLQKTVEKFKQVQGELQAKNSDLETEVSSLKKEIDGVQRNNKHSSANRNTLEVRLNRALEEVEKYKLVLKKSKESSKVMNDTDRKRFEQLQNDNKRLEIQKTELMTAFKKQLKLIDILKRQKMHVEAAKMLEFTEEEFIRALEWGNT